MPAADGKLMIGGRPWFPSVPALLVGGIAGLCSAPAGPLAAGSSTICCALATGYGARWSGSLAKLAGYVGGTILGIVAGSGIGVLVAERGKKLEGASIGGSIVGTICAATLSFILACGGYVGGGITAYKYTKAEMNQLFKEQALRQTQPITPVVQSPARPGGIAVRVSARHHN